MSAKYNLQLVTDYFISFSNETGELISNLKLQKLLYYAQAWHLGMIGQPLFEEDFQAWVHGPVIPESYHLYKHHAWRPLVREDLSSGTFEQLEQQFDNESREIMTGVRDHYFSKGAYELEMLSHRETPWLQARAGKDATTICTDVIDKDWMKQWASRLAVA